MFGGKKHLLTVSISLGLGAVFLDPPSSRAEFTLNFQDRGWGGGFSHVECNVPSSGGSDGWGSDGGGTGWGGFGGGSGGSSFSLGHGCGSGYFLQEVGNGYFHVIVGDYNDPSEDFAMEWYIRVDGSYDTQLSTGYLDNIDDPLGSNVSDTGNGAGNPNTVHMREIVRGNGLDQEFLKASNTYKPKITQGIDDTNFTSHIVLDMTNSGYSVRSTVGTITNTQSILDPDIPDTSAHFDMAQNAPDAHITAGLYSHPGGEFRNYTYAEDSFEVYSVKWIDYCDPSQNPDHDCDIGGNNGAGGWGSSGGGSWGGGGW